MNEQNKIEYDVVIFSMILDKCLVVCKTSQKKN